MQRKRMDDTHRSPPPPQSTQRTRRLLGKDLRLDVSHACLWWCAHPELGAVSKQAPQGTQAHLPCRRRCCLRRRPSTGRFWGRHGSGARPAWVGRPLCRRRHLGKDGDHIHGGSPSGRRPVATATTFPTRRLHRQSPVHQASHVGRRDGLIHPRRRRVHADDPQRGCQRRNRRRRNVTARLLPLWYPRGRGGGEWKRRIAAIGGQASDRATAADRPRKICHRHGRRRRRRRGGASHRSRPQAGWGNAASGTAVSVTGLRQVRRKNKRGRRAHRQHRPATSGRPRPTG